ncbi:cilia- and flagella-associated protein 161 [Cololabis saira]|uniref:cilia- and flagella-associated protein 161 n=1 Tax=Cololabis saira TaxID=129043 RepID=UPI002AD35C53|nr:cilia- and flagella-associated protein 161 [Cololabis saira]
MAHKNTFRSKVKLGYWKDQQLREEDAKKEYLRKKERGELPVQKVDFLKQNMLQPVDLSVTNDGWLHFGDVVMLLNLGGENREISAVSLDADINSLTHIPSPGIQASYGITAGKCIQPCTRTAFIITSVDGSPEGSLLRFEQSFALKTTSDFVKGLYLTSDLQSPITKSHPRELYLDDSIHFLSWWKVMHFDPEERLEHEGLPVPANVKVVIVHHKTNRALAVLGDKSIWTVYGKEYAVTLHTFLDSYKAERDNNHWLLCTRDPAGDGIELFNRPQSEAQNKELP